MSSIGYRARPSRIPNPTPYIRQEAHQGHILSNSHLRASGPREKHYQRIYDTCVQRQRVDRQVGGDEETSSLSHDRGKRREALSNLVYDRTSNTTLGQCDYATVARMYCQ